MNSVNDRRVVNNHRVALDEDFHVHSTFSDGASTLGKTSRRPAIAWDKTEKTGKMVVPT